MARRFFKQFGMTILSLLLISYLVLQLALNVGDLVEIEHVTYATAMDKKELDAYIFRDERVIESNASGTRSYIIDDGEKTNNGQQVAITYSENSSAAVQDRIRDIDRKIAILRKSVIGNGKSTTNLEMLDEKIDALTFDIIRAVNDNDLDKALRLKNDLTVQINRRQALITPPTETDKQTDYEAQIASLTTEKSSLEASLTGASVIHTTTSSGYFYSAIDGYENVFTMEKLQNLTIQEYNELAKETPDQRLIENSVGKLVVDARWFLVCKVDKRTASAYAVGSTYDFVFPYFSRRNLGMKLQRTISQTNLNEVVLIFNTNFMPDGFNYTRTQKVELVAKTYQGLKVPVPAMRSVDGQTGVFALDGNKIIFKKAVVLYEQNDYYICALPVDPQYPSRKDKAYVSDNSVSLYDQVITSGRNIYAGKILT